MKWRSNRKSSNVDDRRGMSSGRSGGGLSPMLIGLLLKLVTSKKGLIIVAVVLGLMYFTGFNPLQFISGGATNQIQNTNYKGSASENELAEMSKFRTIKNRLWCFLEIRFRLLVDLHLVQLVLFIVLEIKNYISI